VADGGDGPLRGLLPIYGNSEFRKTENMQTDPSNRPTFVNLSSRGQITVPAKVRKAAGVEPGDPLAISVEGGRIVITPAILLPAETYTDERIAEFAEAAEMSRDEVLEARRKWRE